MSIGRPINRLSHQYKQKNFTACTRMVAIEKKRESRGIDRYKCNSLLMSTNESVVGTPRFLTSTVGWVIVLYSKSGNGEGESDLTMKIKIMVLDRLSQAKLWDMEVYVR